jgi:hypothetical protein
MREVPEALEEHNFGTWMAGENRRGVTERNHPIVGFVAPEASAQKRVALCRAGRTDEP